MGHIRDNIDRALNAEMDRADFLKVCGVIVLAAIGITGVLKALTASQSKPSTAKPPAGAPADKGAAALNDYARTNDPFARVGKIQVAVDVSSVIRASDSSFRVAWVERRYENGALAATERWTAIVTVVLSTPRDIDKLRKNPLGVFVHAINWSKELG